MAVNVETLDKLERRITLTLAATQISSEVESRLKKLSRSVFWGPMAVAIMGGLIVATALTLLALPAMYSAWFRVKPGTPAFHESSPAGPARSA